MWRSEDARVGHKISPAMLVTGQQEQTCLLPSLMCASSAGMTAPSLSFLKDADPDRTWLGNNCCMGFGYYTIYTDTAGTPRIVTRQKGRRNVALQE